MAFEIAPEDTPPLQDIQDAMGLPWEPANWRVYAEQYPDLQRLLWSKVEPWVATELFVQQALAIAAYAYRETSFWYRPEYEVPLDNAAGARIMRELDAFAYGNAQLLLQQTALSRALRGETVGEEPDTERTERAPDEPYRLDTIPLVDEDAAPPAVRAVYVDIKSTLRLPCVTSDHKAMAKCPAFLRAAWEDAKGWFTAQPCQRLVLELRDAARQGVELASPPVSVRPEELANALPPSTGPDAVYELSDMFTDLLPGLLVNDALFRVAIAGGEEITAPMTERLLHHAA